MTIEKARKVVADFDKSIAETGGFDVYEALMNPNYFPPDYEEAQRTINEWEDSHGVNPKTGKIYKKKYCRKCGGSGHLMCYDHIDKGRCWNCDGIGFFEIYE